MGIGFATADGRPNAGKAAPFAGRYVGVFEAYLQELEITRRQDGSFDISADVGTRGCAGSIDARGAADGEIPKAQARTDDNAICVLKLRRTKKGVRVDEGANCSYFHGFSCGFAGDYREKR